MVYVEKVVHSGKGSKLFIRGNVLSYSFIFLIRIICFASCFYFHVLLHYIDVKVKDSSGYCHFYLLGSGFGSRYGVGMSSFAAREWSIAALDQRVPKNVGSECKVQE